VLSVIAAASNLLARMEGLHAEVAAEHGMTAYRATHRRASSACRRHERCIWQIRAEAELTERFYGEGRNVVLLTFHSILRAAEGRELAGSGARVAGGDGGLGADGRACEPMEFPNCEQIELSPEKK
jgi:hypothetical protein